MKLFCLRLLLFLSPAFLYFSFPTPILWYSKENFYSIKGVLKNQERYIIGYGYNEANYNYLKWENLNDGSVKDIWALGSSRVLAFRKNMFNSSFYNAGYAIYSINDFRSFLSSVPKSKYPKYLIIGLDQWMFNSHWDNLNNIKNPDVWEDSFSFFPKASLYWNIYKDLLAGKYKLNTFKINSTPTKIGINAIINNTGFINDGSMYYGIQITKLLHNDSTANDYKYSNTYNRISSGNSRFEYGDTVNTKAISEVNRLLKFCKENNIEVIAFLPPFANAVYNKMIETHKYSYMQKIYSVLKPVFNTYDFELYNFPTVLTCNSNDNETLDGFHGGELTYQKMLIRMLRSGSILNKVTDSVKLKLDLKQSKNRYVVYE